MAHGRKHPLAAFRKTKGLTQVQAAALVGISQPQWSNLEHDLVYASPKIAKRIATLTGVPMERLLNLTDNDSGAYAGGAPK